jgi:hypothetical protein
MASEFANKTATPFGIYSTPTMWASIVGSGFAVSGVAGDWQAGLQSCSSTTLGFTSVAPGSTAPLLVVQNGTVKVGGTTYDTDVAC